MLTSHENVVIPPESHFFLWLEEKYSRGINKENELNFIKDLFDSTKFETWNISRKKIEKLILGNSLSYSELIQSIYLLYGETHGKKDILAWGDKNKLWKEKLPNIVTHFPNTKFIHIIRDGRDVACSFRELKSIRTNSKYAPKLPTEIDEIALRWHSNISVIERFLNTLKPGNKIALRYEDLLTNPSDELRKLCDFLKIGFSNSMLNYVEENLKHEYEPKEFIAWKHKLNQAIDVSNIGKHKSVLTSLEKQKFNSIASKWLVHYGYEK